jgi:hypothetical protein
MENDTNRFGYNQWFYFSVRGAVANTTYRFKIMNFVCSVVDSAQVHLLLQMGNETSGFLTQSA